MFLYCCEGVRLWGVEVKLAPFKELTPEAFVSHRERSPKAKTGEISSASLKGTYLHPDPAPPYTLAVDRPLL